MVVLDEDGNLFGVVNVIDALVLVVVASVLLAGAGFVGSATMPTGEAATGGHATVAVQGDTTVVGQVVNGTELSTDSGGLVVTDRARVVRSNGTVTTVFRVRRTGGGFLGGQNELAVRPGDRLRTTGTFDGLGLRVLRAGDDPSLDTRRTGLVAEATAAPTTATDALGLLDRARTDGPVRVERVASFPTTGDTRRLRVGLSVRTLTPEDGTESLATGTRLPGAMTGLGAPAEVTSVGRTTPPGERVDRQVVVETGDLAPSVAGALARGDRTVGTNHPATVTNVTERPATLLVTDAEGEVHERPHPRLRSVTLTLSVPARRYGGVLWFQGERLRVGRGLTLDTGRVVVTGNATAVRPTDESPPPGNGTAALVPPSGRPEPGEI
jgi:hypothetical protein